MAEIFKFPYSASRRFFSKQPRRSKNGTPEERAAKAAALLPAPADVVSMSLARAEARSKVDGRKLRGSPLRDCAAVVSFGATVVGKMHTAGLKGEPLAVGFEKAMEALRALEAETYPVAPDLGQPVLNLVTECANSAPERTS